MWLTTRLNSNSDGCRSIICELRIRLSKPSQYARGIATGAGGRRKSSSIVCLFKHLSVRRKDFRKYQRTWSTVESESRWRTRSYWVWLKARSFVKLSAHVANLAISDRIYSRYGFSSQTCHPRYFFSVPQWPLASHHIGHVISSTTDCWRILSRNLRQARNRMDT